MKVITGYPILKVSGGKLEKVSNAKGDNTGTIVEGAAGLATALASRPKRDLSSAEASCGKKPKFGKKKKAAWQDCVNKAVAAQSAASSDAANAAASNAAAANSAAQATLAGFQQPKGGTGMSTGMKIGIAVGVAAVLGVIGFVVYKKMHGKGK